MATIERLNVGGQVVEGILERPNGGGVFLLETVLSENTNWTSKVTSHPVEDGSSISDNIVLNNKKVTATVLISDAAFVTGPLRTEDVKVLIPQIGVIERIVNHIGFLEQFVDSGTVRKPEVDHSGPERGAAAIARRDLEDIRDNKELLTLRTSIGDIDNIVINGVKSTRSSELSNRVYQFTLNMEQIKIVSRASEIDFVERKPEVQDEGGILESLGLKSNKETNISVLNQGIRQVAGI